MSHNVEMAIMAKKVKSFALEEDIYEKLSTKFKENYVDVTISYCLNKYLKEFLKYLETIQEAINESLYTIPMAFVIESVARESLFKILEKEPRPGELESSLQAELDELQRKYDAHIKRNPSMAIDFASSKLEKDFPITTVLGYIGKALAKEIRGRNLTDDQYIELIREVGGKEFQKYLREKAGPAVDKYNPNISEIIKKKIKGSSKDKDKK